MNGSVFRSASQQQSDSGTKDAVGKYHEAIVHRHRVGPAQRIDLGKEKCRIGALSLRQFKVQCSRVQGELPPCRVETDALRQTENPFQPFQTFHRFAPFTTGSVRSSRSKRSTASLGSKCCRRTHVPPVPKVPLVPIAQ